MCVTFSIAVLHTGKYSVIGMMVWSGEGMENSGDGGDASTIEKYKTSSNTTLHCTIH